MCNVQGLAPHRCREGNRLMYSTEVYFNEDDKYSCDHCGSYGLCKEGRLFCRNCQMDICKRCVKELKSALEKISFCSMKCKLILSIKKNDNGEIEMHRCDLCRKMIDNNNPWWNCIHHDYDICTECRLPIDFEKFKDATKIDTCDRAHKLRIGINPKYSYGFLCNICRQSMDRAEVRYICLKCEFDICFDCKPKPLPSLEEEKEPSEELLKKCFNGHNLKFESDEKSKAEYGYFCDYCGKQRFKNEDRFCCKECDYNICNNCSKNASKKKECPKCKHPQTKVGIERPNLMDSSVDLNSEGPANIAH